VVADGNRYLYRYRLFDYLVSDMRNIVGYIIIIITTAVSLALVKFRLQSVSRNGMVMFCVTCKEAKSITEYDIVNSPSGRRIAQGRCSCGTRVNRVLERQ
jgi:hypothetical protein